MQKRSWLGLIVACAVLLAGTAAAAGPRFVTYSGRLSDGTGWGMSTEVSRLAVSLHDAVTGGQALWQQDFQDVALDDGYFSVTLTDGTALATGKTAAVTTIFEAYDAVWVAVAIDSAPEVGPRQAIGSVPYAVKAERLGDVAVTSGALNLYVAESGDDTAGDGTVTNPWRSIQKAVDAIPQIVNHNVNIHVDAGTYAGGVELRGYFGKGQIVIQGDVNDPSSRIVQIGSNDRGIFIVQASATVIISGLTFEQTDNATNGVQVHGSTYVQVSNCAFVGLYPADASGAALLYDMSRGYVADSTFSNYYVAIQSRYGSGVFCHSITGSGNGYGYRGVDAGLIAASANGLSAAINLYNCNNGMVIADNAMVCP